MRAPAILLLLMPTAAAMAIEEPSYTVLEERDGYELRRYEPYLVAETVVEAGFESAGEVAFQRLFRYISGANRGAERIEMTAPVTSRPVRGEKIAMTAPVLSTGSAAGEAEAHRYQFVMPAKFTLETLPRPEDPLVEVRAVPARRVAAHRYSGRWTESNYRRAERLLLDALERDGVAFDGEPILARYNGPFTPWFLRRNEVLVELAD